MQGGEKERTELLRVRLTPEERADIEQRAADNGQTVSDYVRDACQSRPQIDRALIHELVNNVIRAAINLNQITATVNKTKQATPPQLDAAARNVQQIQTDTSAILDAIERPHRATEELRKTRRTVLRLLGTLDGLKP